MINDLKKIFSAYLVFIIFAAPFDHGDNFFPFAFITSLTYLMLSLFIAGKIREKNFQIAVNRFFYPMVLFALAAAATLFYSADKFNTLYGFLKYTNYAIAFFLALNIFDKLEDFERPAVYYISYMTILSGYSILQSLYGWGDFKMAFGSRAQAFFVTPDSFAGFLMTGLILMIAMYVASSGCHPTAGEPLHCVAGHPRGVMTESNLSLRGAQRRSNLILTLVICINFIAFLLTYSRGAWLAFFAAFLFFFIMCLIKKTDKRSLSIFVILAALFVGFISINTLFMKKTAFTRLKTFAQPQNIYSFKSRLLYWDSAVRIIKDYFPKGTGYETYLLVYNKYKNPQFVDERHVFVHNDYLQIAAETGPIGAVLFFSVFLIFFYAAVKSPFRAPFSVGFAAVVFANCLQSSFDFNSYIPGIMFPVFLVIAAFSVMTNPLLPPFSKGGEGGFNTGRFLILPLVITVPLALIIWCPYIAQEYTKKGFDCFNDGKMAESFESFKKAAKFSPLSSDYRGNFGFISNIMSKVDARNKTYYRDIAFKELQKSLDLSPFNVRNYSLMAQYWLDCGKEDERVKAVNYLKKACEIAPADRINNLKLGVAYRTLGRHRKALEEFVKVKKDFPRYANINNEIASEYEKPGEIDKGKKELEK